MKYIGIKFKYRYIELNNKFIFNNTSKGTLLSEHRDSQTLFSRYGDVRHHV